MVQSSRRRSIRRLRPRERFEKSWRQRLQLLMVQQEDRCRSGREPVAAIADDDVTLMIVDFFDYI